MVPLPAITHLQFLLLAALLDGERTGRELRGVLEEQGHKKSAPAFYQLMARMEDAKFVKGRYQPKTVEGQVVKERVYSITATGVTAHRSVREFVQSLGAGYGWKGQPA